MESKSKEGDLFVQNAGASCIDSFFIRSEHERSEDVWKDSAEKARKVHEARSHVSGRFITVAGHHEVSRGGGSRRADGGGGSRDSAGRESRRSWRGSGMVSAESNMSRKISEREKTAQRGGGAMT